MAGLQQEVAVVGTSGRATDSMLRSAGLELVEVGSAEMFADRAALLAGDDDRRARAAAAGQALFESQFTWDTDRGSLSCGDQLALSASLHLIGARHRNNSDILDTRCTAAANSARSSTPRTCREDSCSTRRSSGFAPLPALDLLHGRPHGDRSRSPRTPERRDRPARLARGPRPCAARREGERSAVEYC